MNVCTVVLAAGLGRRFRQVAGTERDKLLEPCKGLDGVVRPVLQHVLLNVAQTDARCIVVTRHDAPRRIALAHGCGHEVVLIDSAGMGDSLAAAVRACTECDGWLVVLGDMPWVRPATLIQVGAGIVESSISVPVAAQGRGHPVGFGKGFASALMALSGDQGGKRLFTPTNVIEQLTADPGIYRDVDTPADLSASV